MFIYTLIFSIFWGFYAGHLGIEINTLLFWIPLASNIIAYLIYLLEG